MPLAIRQAMTKDDDEAFEKACESIDAKQTIAKGQEKAKNFAAYCAHHRSALVARMRHETCGSCIEPQVSHVLFDRLSCNPVVWSREGLNRMTMWIVYTKNGGKVCGEDVRIRLNSEAGKGFREDGYAPYRDYAMKQADDVLKAKRD